MTAQGHTLDTGCHSGRSGEGSQPAWLPMKMVQILSQANSFAVFLYEGC